MNVYCVYLKIDSKHAEDFKKNIKKKYHKSKKIYDIYIDFNGIKKQFTFEQFSKRLGLCRNKKNVSKLFNNTILNDIESARKLNMIQIKQIKKIISDVNKKILEQTLNEFPPDNA